MQGLPIVDEEIIIGLDAFNPEFWGSRKRDPREDIHALFQYPAMMVPSIQRELINLFVMNQPGITEVLDPYVGASTTMTASMPFSLNFTGQDINPVAVLISWVKAGPFFQRSLTAKAEELENLINCDTKNNIEVDFSNIDKWFQKDIQIELSKIVRAIRVEKYLWARRFFWVALAETVRVVSNDRTSTYKLHIRPKEEITQKKSAIDMFSTILFENLKDYNVFRNFIQGCGSLKKGRYVGNLRIFLHDTTQGIKNFENGDKKYDLLLTSPPYGDNISTVSYGQHSYLPLQWIDFEDIGTDVEKGEWLRTTQEIDRRSLGGQTLRNMDLDETVSELEKLSEEFKLTIQKLNSKPIDRKARVASFISDLNKSIDPIVHSLRTNAYMAWFIGNRRVGGVEIPTGNILIELLEAKGAAYIISKKRKIVFRRMATRNRITSMIREERLLVFRKNE